MSKIITLNKRQQNLPKVKVVIPYNGTLAKPAQVLNEQLTYYGIPGYFAVVRKFESTIIQFARNQVIDEAPEYEYDYLFFVDDDLGLDDHGMMEKVEVIAPGGGKVEVPRMIAMMKQVLDHSLNICCGYYCQRGAGFFPMVFKKVDVPTENIAYEYWFDCPDKGVHEVDAVATGFMCIKREVLRRFRQDLNRKVQTWTRFKKWRADEQAYNALPEEVREYIESSRPMFTPPFWTDYFWDSFQKRWDFMGEDFWFCREAQRLGYKIYVDFEIQLGHLLSEWYITPAKYRHAYKENAVKTHETWMKDRWPKPEELETQPNANL